MYVIVFFSNLVILCFYVEEVLDLGNFIVIEVSWDVFRLDWIILDEIYE